MRDSQSLVHMDVHGFILRISLIYSLVNSTKITFIQFKSRIRTELCPVCKRDVFKMLRSYELP